MPLFSVAAKNWLSQKASLEENLTPKTVAGYRQRTASLVEAFGHRLVCDIALDDVRAYREQRLTPTKDRPAYSARAVNYEMVCLGGVLGTYGLWESISREIKHLKENEDVGQAISYENEMALLTACINSGSPVLYPLFVLSIDAGPRASELKRLRLRDLSKITRLKSSSANRNRSRRARYSVNAAIRGSPSRMATPFS